MTEPKAYRIQMTRQHDDVQEMDDGVLQKLATRNFGDLVGADSY